MSTVVTIMGKTIDPKNFRFFYMDCNIIIETKKHFIINYKTMKLKYIILFIKSRKGYL
jgi:hypothetical protein